MDAYLKDQFDFTGVKAALLVEQSILVILRDNKPDIPWPNTWGVARWRKRRSRNTT